jgi:hypothetical protein
LSISKEFRNSTDALKVSDFMHFPQCIYNAHLNGA